MIFYPTTKAGTIRLVNTKINNKLPARIKLALPSKMDKAYPKFKLEDAKFKLVFTDKTIKKVIIPVTISEMNGKTKLRLGKVTGENKDNFRCEKDVEVTLSIEQKDDIDMPTIYNGVIILKKLSC